MYEQLLAEVLASPETAEDILKWIVVLWKGIPQRSLTALLKLIQLVSAKTLQTERNEI